MNEDIENNVKSGNSKYQYRGCVSEEGEDVSKKGLISLKYVVKEKRNLP